MNFDQNTVEVLNDIARLLCISQELRKMELTFKNATDIDNGAAKVPARKVLMRTQAAGKSLLTSVFKAKGGEFTGAQLLEARSAVARPIERVIRHAKTLAKFEHAAYAGGTAKGNVIQIRVVAPLECLVADWRRQAADIAHPH